MNEIIIEVMKNSILSPILYKLEDNGVVNIFGFFDREVPVEKFYEIQRVLESRLGRIVQIYDIRDFEEGARLDLIRQSELVYSESSLVKTLFEGAMIEDLQEALTEKKSALDRVKNSGTIYYS